MDVDAAWMRSKYPLPDAKVASDTGAEDALDKMVDAITLDLLEGQRGNEDTYAWVRRVAIAALATDATDGATGGGEVQYQGCNRPPDGWWCCSEPGHDGPCPTRRIGEL